jgi:hypothetical protein
MLKFVALSIWSELIATTGMEVAMVAISSAQ